LRGIHSEVSLELKFQTLQFESILSSCFTFLTFNLHHSASLPPPAPACTIKYGVLKYIVQLPLPHGPKGVDFSRARQILIPIRIRWGVSQFLSRLPSQQILQIADVLAVITITTAPTTVESGIPAM
jgi:hypothetical protein